MKRVILPSLENHAMTKPKKRGSQLNESSGILKLTKTIEMGFADKGTSQVRMPSTLPTTSSNIFYVVLALSTASNVVVNVDQNSRFEKEQKKDGCSEEIYHWNRLISVKTSVFSPRIEVKISCAGIHT